MGQEVVPKDRRFSVWWSIGVRAVFVVVKQKEVKLNCNIEIESENSTGDDDVAVVADDFVPNAWTTTRKTRLFLGGRLHPFWQIQLCRVPK